MDLGSGARVWFVPVLLTAAMLIACGSAAPDEIVRSTDAMARDADADRAAIAAGVLPDLRGRELNEVGDQVGTLARYDTACPGDVQVGPDFLDDD